MTGKFGTAKEWFTFGLSVFFPGLAVFGGSFASFVGEFEFAARMVGIVAATAGLAIVLAGLAVWRYNLKQESKASVVVVGRSSSGENRRSDLSAKRDSLEVERAGLQPFIRIGLDSNFAVSSIIRRMTPEEASMHAESERARTRDKQIGLEIRAIDQELMDLLTQKPSKS
ncbi:hypothetical protein KZC51_05990 [Microbacterium sp. SSW1-49]|uniref:Uncharacterized protein n=1 Tax=Microbacterium croceum TaxID=2851645 RepID=A0ABT0FC97_9MICO|nr:hypothetical protein [Microbacterium croceum]MCK2035682.1 hypothetical protein [Microbacterium croceum]